MAALGIDDDELKAVEQTLSRVAQLNSSIWSLKKDILQSNPLPPPSSLQASVQILQRNLQTVLDSLSENSELFARMAIHPSPNFPGRSQETILTQLLRKKLEPDVEELVAVGRETARLATPAGVAQLADIWDELRRWTHQRIADYVRDEANDVYTAEERALGIDRVRTGLRRDLEDESEEEDEDEEEDDDGDGDVDMDQDRVEKRRKPTKERERREEALLRDVGPEPETLLWFAARADFELPKNVEYERKVAAKKGLQGVGIPPDRMDLVG